MDKHIENMLAYLSDKHQASKEELIEEAVQEYYADEVKDLIVTQTDCSWK